MELYVTKFSRAAPFRYGLVLEANARFYNENNGINYKVMRSSDGRITIHDSLAEDIAANPSEWEEVSPPRPRKAVF